MSLRLLRSFRRTGAGWQAWTGSGWRRLRAVLLSRAGQASGVRAGLEARRTSRFRNFAWHSSAKVNFMGSASSPLLYSAKAKPT